MASTIEVTVNPRGYPWFLVGGLPPGLEEMYYAPEGSPPEYGGGYTAYYWRQGEPVYVAWPEAQRVRRMAKGKRKPFTVALATVAPLPGVEWHARSVLADWAKEAALRQLAE
jgi:hypothetical protein